MSEVSSLTELARFIGKSGFELQGANAGGIVVNGPVVSRPGKPKVTDLLAVVMSLSARTRRMVLPKVEIELDVFGPEGRRAVRVRLPA